MHKTHIFDQKNNAKKIFLSTYLPYFFTGRYRKQTIYFFRPNYFKPAAVKTTFLGANFLIEDLRSKYMWESDWLELDLYVSYATMWN